MNARWSVVGVAALAACRAGTAGQSEAGDASAGGAPNAPPPAFTPPPAVSSLVGEIHLHQFPQGSHAWAAFLAKPVGFDHIVGDSITELPFTPTRVESVCTLTLAPSCAPACATTSYCSGPSTCTPLPDPSYVDGGEVDVTGSALVPTIRILPGDAGAYASIPPPGKVQLFAGGESLALHDGEGGFAFDTTLPAPPALELLSPDPSAPLALPTHDALALRWTSAHTDEVIVRVFVSANDGRTATIRCDTSDTGALDVPADLLAALPPPPRSTRLEVDRAEQRIVSTATPGVGVLVHAAQTTWMNGQD